MVDIGNLAACIEDARRATLDRDPGPADPLDYHNLRGRPEASRDKLPPLYREIVFEPYTQKLDELGVGGFASILRRDPSSEGEAGAMFDIAQAILQNGERYQPREIDAFQEVISDLFDGFLSKEDCEGIKPPDKMVYAPLVKAGRPAFGPYTWSVAALTALFNVKTSLVNLPPGNVRGGLLSWAALGHETGGHNILDADDGLLPELADLVEEALTQADLGRVLATYWSDRITYRTTDTDDEMRI